ncbi:hypothetical protein FR991_22135 [Bacteroides fragilis]|uniref:Uncharacterized protein n=2 Tax=Bacteroides fragilis TaxID=817 RepID=A0A415A7V5_BACFG|nr:hypothetical protein M118_1438 [Bacteroides fragilis str. 3783N1-2]KAA4698327.1 hypothetical protein F3B28_16720 [Bacteroides fragilis]KAA4708949.1 hypothetical protein F3B27_07915 [Bacteroides fragilis]KAA4715840.1 hypothetical protein F3B32_15685 [Bacteroides fragilis]KAA4724681.1 hypothetical protein F3B30_18870 [Bacteroides fragilis]
MIPLVLNRPDLPFKPMSFGFKTNGALLSNQQSRGSGDTLSTKMLYLCYVNKLKYQND